MSMIQAIATVDVYTHSGFERQKVEVTVDDSTLRLASTESGRRQLDPWAKNLFPAAEKVRVYGVERVR